MDEQRLAEIEDVRTIMLAPDIRVRPLEIALMAQQRISAVIGQRPGVEP